MDKIKPLSEHVKLYRDHLIDQGMNWNPLRVCLYDILEFHDDAMEQKDLLNVDCRQVQRYRKAIRGKHAGRKEKAVSEFYDFLLKQELVGSNPFGGRHG
jgi:hypothetical protein